jgi:hypothetical protein
MRVRIPGWALGEAVPSQLYTFSQPTKEKVKISINGVVVEYPIEKGYAVLTG